MPGTGIGIGAPQMTVSLESEMKNEDLEMESGMLLSFCSADDGKAWNQVNALKMEK